MAPTRILTWWGNTMSLVAGLMLLAAVLALPTADISSTLGLVIAATITALLGGITALAVKDVPARDGPKDALAFLVIFWATLPFAGALPFILLGGTSSPLIAWFEAVSAFTTTGASTLVPETLPRALLLWRSLLQFFGGVSVATLAVVVLASLNLTGTGIHRSALFTIEKGQLFVQLLRIGLVVTMLYTTIALIGFVMMVVGGAPLFDALNLALTGVSTGGLTTRSVPLAEYMPLGSSAVLAVICVLGAASVAAHWDIFRIRSFRELRSFVRNVEHRALIGLLVGVGLLGFSYTGFRHFTTVALEAAYLVSSTGYDYNVIGLELLPPAILIAVALIGGSALSTAGGLKLIRMLLLFRHLRVDVERLSHPSRVKPVRFRGRTIPDSSFLSIWMYFIGFTLMFGLGTLCLGAAGLTYEVAVPAAAASLSNVGPLLEANMTATGWADFSDLQLAISGALMLVGRVEVLAILAFLFSTSR